MCAQHNQSGSWWRFVAGLLSLWLSAGSPLCSVAKAAEEPPADDGAANVAPAAEFPPIPNARYFNVRVTSRVARKFEMYSPHSVEALRELKALGFTQVILDWPNLHADASAAGLDVVLSNWWNEKTPPEEMSRILDFARTIDSRRLAGISVMDEPERNSPDTPFGFYVDLYEQLRPRVDEKLPGVKLELSYWGPLARWDQRYYDYFSHLYEAADVMRIMPYPDLGEGPLGEVFLMMLRAREVMKIAERDIPHVVILQTWVLPPKSELPTIPELRVMAYQALLGGADVVSFFDHNVDVWNAAPGFREEFGGLMRELTALSARLSDATIAAWLTPEGIFHAEVHGSGGLLSTIRVNTSRGPVAGLAGLEIVEEPAQPPVPSVTRVPPPCYCPPPSVHRRLPLRRAHPLRNKLFPRLFRR